MAGGLSVNFIVFNGFFLYFYNATKLWENIFSRRLVEIYLQENEKIFILFLIACTHRRVFKVLIYFNIEAKTIDLVKKFKKKSLENKYEKRYFSECWLKTDFKNTVNILYVLYIFNTSCSKNPSALE